MLGGYQIIDLLKIGLVLGSSLVSITDSEVLKQLRSLRDYIEKGHDYTKALNKSLKPILIRQNAWNLFCLIPIAVCFL